MRQSEFVGKKIQRGKPAILLTSLTLWEISCSTVANANAVHQNGKFPLGMLLEIYLSNCITGPIHVGTFDIFWDIFVKLYQWTHPHGHLWDAHYTTSNLIINLPPLQTCHCVKLREILKVWNLANVWVWYCMSLILCESDKSDIVWVWYRVSLIL